MHFDSKDEKAGSAMMLQCYISDGYLDFGWSASKAQALNPSEKHYLFEN